MSDRRPGALRPVPSYAWDTGSAARAGAGTEPGPGSEPGGGIEPAAPVDLAALRLLVVEDDEGDTLYLAGVMQEAGIAQSAVRWCRTLTEGRAAMAESPADCVLVDLGLPDASGLDSVHGMVTSPDTAVVVLTGLAGTSGQPAIAAGAQDYLVKDGLHPDVLARAVRYAVVRKRAERTSRQLDRARQRSAENARLERGLLPRPILDRRRLAWSTTYRAGRDDTLLGGDFYDIVERGDGSVRMVIGDVMGHGPDEAALGVHLRVAWRSLVLAGIADDDVLRTLDSVLAAEAAPGGPFVTACDVTVWPDLRGATVRSAGHPAPVVAAGPVVYQPELTVMPPLGIGAPAAPASTDVVLGDSWQLMLYTDGLLDSFRDSSDVCDIGLTGLVHAATVARDADPRVWTGDVIARAHRAVTDDMAVVAVGTVR